MLRGHDVDTILILDVLHGIHGQNHRAIGRVLLHQIRNRHLGQTLSLTERRGPALGRRPGVQCIHTHLLEAEQQIGQRLLFTADELNELQELAFVDDAVVDIIHQIQGSDLVNVDLDANQHTPADHLFCFIDDKPNVSTGKGGNGFVGLLHFHIGEDLPVEGLVARVVITNGSTHHINLGAAGIAVVLSASFGITRILLANLLFQLGNAACIFGLIRFVLGTIGFTLCILLCHTCFVQILFGPALCVDRVDTRTKSLHTALIIEVLPILGVRCLVEIREDLRVRSLQHLIRCFQTCIDVLHVEIGQRGHCCGGFLQSGILLRSFLFRNGLGFRAGGTALPIAEFLTALLDQLQTFVDDLDVTTILLHERFGIGNGRTIEPNLEFALRPSLLVLLILPLVSAEVLRVLALQFVELGFQRTKFGQVGTREDLVLRDRLQREHDRVDSCFHVSLIKRFRSRFVFDLALLESPTLPFDGKINRRLHRPVHFRIGRTKPAADLFCLFEFLFRTASVDQTIDLYANGNIFDSRCTSEHLETRIIQTLLQLIVVLIEFGITRTR